MPPLRVVEDLAVLAALPSGQRLRCYVPEQVTTAYPIHECGEPLLSLSELFERSSVSVRLAPSDPGQDPRLSLRAGAALRLIEAARRLTRESDGQLILSLDDAFRPLSVQRRYFSEAWARAKRLLGEGTDARAIWVEVTKWVADPDLTPPHCTGGAIDLTIARADTGIALEMGTPYTGLDGLLDVRSHTWNTEVSPLAQGNRTRLFDLMTAVGFVNLPTEWWHYSYGDQMWALLSSRPFALYSAIEPQPPVEIPERS